ncbi:hypothetical protein LguiA_003131 [Lonicera macranthoides]
MDVKSAFLNGFIEEEVYVKQPPGFEKNHANDMLLVQIYVDDIIFGSTNDNLCKEFSTCMQKKFEMSMMREMNYFLGLQVKQCKDGIFVNQEKYVKELLKKFDMEGAKSMSTPMSSTLKLDKDESGKSVDIKKYRGMIGSLLYLTASRPDLAHAVGMVSRYMSNPGKEHWNAVKWVLRYLQGTKSLGIVFERKDGADSVAGFVDSDYTGDLDKRRSTTGYVFTLASGPVSWRSMLQATSALSTTEAEYMALTEASKHERILLRCDSQSALYLAKNQVYHARTKHIDVRYHRVRDWVNSGEVVLEKVNTNENAADMLTKPITAEKFRHCLKLLNLTSC